MTDEVKLNGNMLFGFLETELKHSSFKHSLGKDHEIYYTEMQNILKLKDEVMVAYTNYKNRLHLFQTVFEHGIEQPRYTGIFGSSGDELEDRYRMNKNLALQSQISKQKRESK